MNCKFLLLLVLISMAPLTGWGQGRGSQTSLKTVTGRVVNAQDQPLAKAVVHLKNTKTLVIKTYITERDGSYRFSALSPNVDYEIYAEYQGDRSDNKTVSAFDDRKQVIYTLKIRTGK